MAKQLGFSIPALHTHFFGVMDTKITFQRVTYGLPDSTSGEQYSIVPQKV